MLGRLRKQARDPNADDVTEDEGDSANDDDGKDSESNADDDADQAGITGAHGMSPILLHDVRVDWGADGLHSTLSTDEEQARVAQTVTRARASCAAATTRCALLLCVE